MKHDGNAIVYCQGAFNTPTGKTAHGLVRFTHRYRVVAVIDGHYENLDAGQVLDGKPKGIPVCRNLEHALGVVASKGMSASHLVMGLAPDGGRLPQEARAEVAKAIGMGLHIDSGLHDFLNDDPEIARLAEKHQVRIRDVRRPPDRKDLHFFTGDIETVTCLKVAILGTDSAVGKRTTAWLLVHALQAAGIRAEMIGTGQTAWMQGAQYGVVMDSLINDFVAGEIENAVVSAWREKAPQVMILEGQGSLMNPAYPGGFEILAAGRPDIVMLQHAPARKDYDGFPGYAIHPLPQQIQVMELLSGKPVVAITINHEHMKLNALDIWCDAFEQAIGKPVVDPLIHGVDRLVGLLKKYL